MFSRSANFFLRKTCDLRGFATVSEIVGSSPSKIAVFYGTHSGNTQKSAHALQSELKYRFNVNASLANLAETDFKGLEQLQKDATLVFLVSTYGDGEPNDATRDFWNYVHASAESRQKYQFAFSILSRGNSLYDSTFARAGILLDAKLHGLGATRLSPVGIQDKISSRSDDEYFQWKEKLLNEIKHLKGFVERPYQYESSVEVKEVLPGEVPEGSMIHKLYHRLDPRAMPCDIRVEQLESTDRQYVHADINVPNYQSGDYVALWPRNPEPKVQEFLAVVFGNDKRRFNLLQLKDGRLTSFETLARHLIDVNGQPDHELLFKLSHMAPSKDAAHRCNELLMDSSRELPGLVELLKELSPDKSWISSLAPSAFFDVLPPLEPRRYSVSSSSSESPEWAGITCVVEEDKATGFRGVATSELLGMADKANTTIMAVAEPLPSFRLPSDRETPLLLFGVGTGVAPFRGFIRERAFQAKDGSVGPVALFTGTRTKQDLVHHEELENAAQKQPFDLTLIPAYSRVSKTDPNYGYLVEMLDKNADLIFDYIQKGAHVYICGDVRKVRNTVRRRLMEIVLSKLGDPLSETKPLWKKLTREGRTHLELW